MEEIACARRVLETVAATWPRFPRPLTEAVGQLLSHADHTHGRAGREGGAALDEGFAASRDRVLQIVLGSAGAPTASPPFASYVIDLILDDDTHPFLTWSAAHGPTGADGAHADLMARDLQRLQSLAAVVDRALGLHGCAATWADCGAEVVASPPRRDPFVLDDYPWSPRGPRADLRRRFLRESDWGTLNRALGDMVRRYGMGKEQGCVAFRLAGDGARLVPIRDFAAFDLAWLAGIEERVALLEENTRNLLGGFRAHNALIWGPRGCGKSTLIRGLITRYWEAGLRGIDVPPEAYGQLRDLLGRVRGRREYYVAVLDNLALERHDPASRLLSTVLDGGLEEMPRNLVFYATSNYKDLVDREGERPQGPPPLQVDGVLAARRTTDMTTAPVQGYDPQGFQRLDERRALDDRFALKVFIDLPTKVQYEQLVVDYARRAGVDVVEPELLAEFHVWRMRHNHDLVGGRTARDFILWRYPGHVRRRGMG